MLCTRSSTPGALGSRRLTVAVSCLAKPEASTRRALLVGTLAGVASLSAVAAPKVLAADFKEALAKKEARKARLREAAGAIKSTGKDQQVFKKSAYSMPDDANTPNVHTRQNEGARTQDNV